MLSKAIDGDFFRVSKPDCVVGIGLMDGHTTGIELFRNLKLVLSQNNAAAYAGPDWEFSGNTPPVTVGSVLPGVNNDHPIVQCELERCSTSKRSGTTDGVKYVFLPVFRLEGWLLFVVDVKSRVVSIVDPACVFRQYNSLRFDNAVFELAAKAVSFVSHHVSDSVPSEKWAVFAVTNKSNLMTDCVGDSGLMVLLYASAFKGGKDPKVSVLSGSHFRDVRYVFGDTSLTASKWKEFNGKEGMRVTDVTHTKCTDIDAVRSEACATPPPRTPRRRASSSRKARTPQQASATPPRKRPLPTPASVSLSKRFKVSDPPSLDVSQFETVLSWVCSQFPNDTNFDKKAKLQVLHARLPSCPTIQDLLSTVSSADRVQFLRSVCDRVASSVRMSSTPAYLPGNI